MAVDFSRVVDLPKFGDDPQLTPFVIIKGHDPFRIDFVLVYKDIASNNDKMVEFNASGRNGKKSQTSLAQIRETFLKNLIKQGCLVFRCQAENLATLTKKSKSDPSGVIEGEIMFVLVHVLFPAAERCAE